MTAAVLFRTVLGNDGNIYPAGSTPPSGVAAGITNPSAWRETGGDDAGGTGANDPALPYERLYYPVGVADPGAAGWRIATANFVIDGRFYYVGSWVRPDLVAQVRASGLIRVPNAGE